jgi:transposase-like protein
MRTSSTSFKPPFCPNPACVFHRLGRSAWRWAYAGFYERQASPQRIQRFQCCHCRRYFSTQTFSITYWLKRPDLLPEIFHQLVACSGFRQIARRHDISPQTVLTHSARLGRHCQLFHEIHRPLGPLREPIDLDGFHSFEFSQFYPSAFHLVVGKRSHWFYGFSDSELRRSGTMTKAQRKKRAELEARLGRPDPRSTEREVAGLLAILARKSKSFDLHTDEHADYPRAIRRLAELLVGLVVEHNTISSRASRTPQNPLWPINLLDGLIRHSGANHKRETIAHSKRRQSAAERLWAFLVWRNYIKWFSEQRRDETPAMRLGVMSHRLTVPGLLKERLFPSRIELPERWAEYYWRRVKTRIFVNNREHQLRFAA